MKAKTIHQFDSMSFPDLLVKLIQQAQAHEDTDELREYLEDEYAKILHFQGKRVQEYATSTIYKQQLNRKNRSGS